MKFLKLEILNLASLDKTGGEVINFEEGALGESTIFSIVGPTGSGKSTILDAICLALYNRAPRYPRKKGEKGKIEIYGALDGDENNRLAPTDGRNILSRGKNVGYSKLTFQANNGDVYRAEWHVKKPRIKYNTAVTLLYKIVKKENAWVEESCTWDDLPQIIGLDYDQFLRTVLIAQGSFANFLTAKEDERYELLEKLVGCGDMYIRIAKEIKERKDSAEASYNEIKAQFVAFEKDDLLPEQLEELKKQIEELKAAEKERNTELDLVKKALEWYGAEKKIKSNINEYEAAMNRAREGLNAIRGKMERLALHDATLEAVGYYKEWKAKEQSVVKIGSELEQQKKDVEARKSDIEKEEKILLNLKSAVEDAKRVWEEQKPHINQARTLKGELDVASKQVNEMLSIKNTASMDVDSAYNALEVNKKRILEYKAQMQKATEKQEIFDAEYLAKKKDWDADVLLATRLYLEEEKKMEGKQAEELQLAKENAISKQQDLKNALRVLNDWREKDESRLKKLQDRERLEKENGEIREELERLTIKDLKEDIGTLQKTHTLIVSENWKRHRHSLEDGKPCPLCGAKHHPYQDNEVFQPVVDELEQQINKKQQELEEQQKIMEDKTRKQSENQGLLKSIGETLPLLEKEMKRLREDWTEISSNHPDWPEDVSILQAMQESVNEEAERAKEALLEYNRISTQVKKLRVAKENKETERENFVSIEEERKKKLEKLKVEANVALATEEGKTENLEGQKLEKEEALRKAKKALDVARELVSQKEEAMKLEIGERDPDVYEEELSHARTEAEKAVETRIEQIAVLKQQLEGVNGSIQSKETLLAQEREACSTKKQLLTEWLVAYNGTEECLQALTQEDIAALSEAKEPWEEIRKEKDEKVRVCVSTETTYRNEVDSYKNHLQTKPQEEEQKLQERKMELEGKDNKELVEKEACLQRYETAQAQMGAMHDRKQELERRLADWKDILDAVGGSDGSLVRKIAQCYTLRFLVEHANAEIRKFNSRYELVQVKNSLAIRVVDHDRADDVRETTSLSGGETFIVSLGLALGLSALSSRNISFGNLFIDEGFGTLDPDTLATVIDSLAMLQTSQGKKVGVISHTDTMSERITTQIRVIKNGTTGSSHIEIYP